MVCWIEKSNHCDCTVDVTPHTNRTEESSLVSYGIFLIDVLIIDFAVLHSYYNIQYAYITRFIVAYNIVDTVNTLECCRSAMFERLSRSVYNTTRKADDDIGPVMYFRLCSIPQYHNSVLSL